MSSIVYLKHIDPSIDTVFKVWVSYENDKQWVGTCCGNAMPFDKHLYEETDERPAYEHPDFYKQPLTRPTRKQKPVQHAPVDLPEIEAWF